MPELPHDGIHINSFSVGCNYSCVLPRIQSEFFRVFQGTQRLTVHHADRVSAIGFDSGIEFLGKQLRSNRFGITFISYFNLPKFCSVTHD